ncbi:MAG: hypothetical protein ACRC37_00075, partial [Lentisphaeria bacterium]
MTYLNENFDTKQENYNFYYDESNNIRKFSIDGNQYNIKNYSSTIFILAGVVHESNINIEMSKLINELKSQKSSAELKFKHIARGNFIEILSSEKLTSFLTFILENSIYIHYLACDFEYFSFLDIVEDVMIFHKINVDVKEIYRLKDALNEVINKQKNEFLRLASKYKYPKIESTATSKFIKDINILIKNSLVNESKNTDLYKSLISLSNLFSSCSYIKYLPLTFAENENSL